MNSNKMVKLIGTIVGVLLFIILIAGVSYAWVTWNSSNITISGKSECFNINYTNGQALSREDVLLFDENTIISDNRIVVREGMALLNVTASIDNNCDIMADFVVSLNVTALSSAYISGNSVGAFKYALVSYDPNTYTSITDFTGASFEIIQSESITNTGLITFEGAPLNYNTKGYLLVFYVDGDLAMNDAEYSTFSATITGTAVQVE